MKKSIVVNRGIFGGSWGLGSMVGAAVVPQILIRWHTT